MAARILPVASSTISEKEAGLYVILPPSSLLVGAAPEADGVAWQLTWDPGTAPALYWLEESLLHDAGCSLWHRPGHCVCMAGWKVCWTQSCRVEGCSSAMVEEREEWWGRDSAEQRTGQGTGGLQKGGSSLGQ